MMHIFNKNILKNNCKKSWYHYLNTEAKNVLYYNNNNNNNNKNDIY